jgi:hypothetical protein
MRRSYVSALHQTSRAEGSSHSASPLSKEIGSNIFTTSRVGYVVRWLNCRSDAMHAEREPLFESGGHVWRSRRTRGALSDRFVVVIGVLGHEEHDVFVWAVLPSQADGPGRRSAPCVEVESYSCILNTGAMYANTRCNLCKQRAPRRSGHQQEPRRNEKRASLY